MADSDTITLQLTLTAEQGQPRVPLSVSKSATCSALRQQISEETKIPKASLKLIFRGRLIGDDETKVAATEFKLEDGSVLHCMGKPVKDGPSGDAVVAPSVPAAAASVASMPAAAGSSVSVQPTPTVPAAPAATQDPLKTALQTLRASNSPAQFETAVSTLEKLLNKIAKNPMEEKYRRVKKQNAAFQKRLGGLTGGDAAMKAAGFATLTDNGEEVYMMLASADAWPKLMAAKATVEAAVRDAKAANQSTGPPPVASMPGSTPNFGNSGIGGMPAGGAGVPPNVANIMSDPNALQSMLQNPMVQQMMRNDPRFANNPMAQQAMDQLASNPQVLNEVAQMMRDPNMQQQMQAMMQQQGGAGGMPPMGGFGSTGGAMGTGAAAQAPQQQQSSNQGQSSGNSGANDEEMTEDQMIAEAIRRSLQDNS